MERLKGVPLTDLAAIRRVTSADPEGVLINALNVWFGSVLACETFHADMHAGAHSLAEHNNLIVHVLWLECTPTGLDANLALAYLLAMVYIVCDSHTSEVGRKRCL